jgi:hypothetical protein
LVQSTDQNSNYGVSSSPNYLVPLRPKYSPQHLFSSTLALRSSFNTRDKVSHPYASSRQYYNYAFPVFHTRFMSSP